MIRIGATEENILRKITESISNRLNTAGIFNRVFSRIKSKNSIEKKLEEKRAEYILKNKKIQDVFGIRVTVYFSDDEQIAVDLVKKLFEEIPSAHSIDPLYKDRFGPIRNNLVFKISDSLVLTSSLFDQELIDSTFEVQFRTVFSEGWHEVEHDLRYKCKKDWNNEDSLFRQLNGQFATLETCNWAMLKIFDELSYKKYKAKEWDSFFRNILRIRFEDMNFSAPIIDLLNSNPSVAKEFLRLDRDKLILSLTSLTTNIPLKMDNILFIINRAIIKNRDLISLESLLLQKILNESFPTQ
jgi:putative GTP pyrophosphokinase